MLDRLSVVTLGPYVYVKERIRKRKATKLLEKAELTESLRREELFTATYCCQQADRRWTELSWPHTTSCQLPVTAKPLYYEPQTQFHSLAPPTVHPDSDVDSIYTDNLDPHLLICTTFWRSSLTLSKHKCGDDLLDFGSLWPNEDKLKSVLQEVRHVTSLRHALGDLLRLCLQVGPLRVLKALIEEQIVDKNAVLDGGRSLLHVACIHGNMDAVLYLCTMDVNTHVTDQQGKTPRDVCRSENVTRLLPNTATDLLLRSRSRSRSRSTSRSSEDQEVNRSKQDSPVKKKPLTSEIQRTIFELFHDIRNWEDVSLLLQDYQFSIDKERDEYGDLLVHIAAKKGISHIGALLGLIRHLGASCDVADTSGCTPLVLAVCNDDDIMADVLLCVLGADINFPHPETGWTALHYAANLNSLNFVSLLLKRGANMNAESAAGLRADDICHKGSDSAAYIQRARQARAASLSAQSAKGTLTQQELYDEDMFEVDVRGDTLLMAAVRHNQAAQLTYLLRRRCAPIDAQNIKTGQTALSIAAQEDYVEIIHILLRSGAAPGVVDMEGWTAVMRATHAGKEASLTALLEYPSALVGLQAALGLAQTRRIHLTLSRAITKRQVTLVTPALFEAAMTGNMKSVVHQLEDGDDINPASCAHDWPVYIAAANGHLQVVKFLHQRGGDLACRHQTSGNTVLHVAAAGNHGAVVDFLLDHYSCAGSEARRCSVNARNADGKTALHIAADKGYIRIVDKLLQAGASAVVTDSSGALYQCRGYQGIQALLDKARRHHADLVFGAINKKNPTVQLQNLFLPEFDHNLRNDKGDTPLMVAAYLGKLDAVNYLLQSATVTQSSFGQLPRSTSKTSLLDRISRKRRSQTNKSQQGVYEEIKDLTTPDTDSAVEVDIESGPLVGDGHRTGGLVRGCEGTRNGTMRAMHRSKRRKNDSDGMQSGLSNRLEGGRDDLVGLEYQRCLNRREFGSVWSEAKESGHGHHDLGIGSLDNNRDGIRSRADKELPYNSEKCSTSKLTMEDYATWSQTTASLLYGDDGEPEPSTDLYDNTYHRHLYYLSASTAPSHVCTHSLRDGGTALHRAIQGGDRTEVVQALLLADSDVINLQDEVGLTPLHVACRLGRRKAAKLLLAQPGIDINLRTLEGHLADELTTNKTLRRLVQENRQPDTEQVFMKGHKRLQIEKPPPAQSEASSSISFDGINTRFVILKQRWLARQRQQQHQRITHK